MQLQVAGCRQRGQSGRVVQGGQSAGGYMLLSRTEPDRPLHELNDTTWMVGDDGWHGTQAYIKHSRKEERWAQIHTLE